CHETLLLYGSCEFPLHSSAYAPKNRGWPPSWFLSCVSVLSYSPSAGRYRSSKQSLSVIRPTMSARGATTHSLAKTAESLCIVSRKHSAGPSPATRYCWPTASITKASRRYAQVLKARQLLLRVTGRRCY